MALNKNLLQIKNLDSKSKFINVKIVSPNFDLKYNLTDEELNSRFKKLVKYSEPDKDKEHFLYGLKELCLANISVIL